MGHITKPKGKGVRVIKPVGRERDVRIAELKGIEEVYWDYKEIGRLKPIALEYPVANKFKKGNIYYVPCGKPWEGTSPKQHSILPHWSTNRNDAWELWGELPLVEKIRLLTALLSFYWGLREWEKEGKKKPDPDWADFITVAWITWKENQ